MSSVRYVAMWGTLQISPQPRILREAAEEDAARWERDQQRQGRIVTATIVEVKREKNLGQ